MVTIFGIANLERHANEGKECTATRTALEECSSIEGEPVDSTEEHSVLGDEICDAPIRVGHVVTDRLPLPSPAIEFERYVDAARRRAGGDVEDVGRDAGHERSIDGS